MQPPPILFATASYSMYQDDYEEQFNKNLWSTSLMPYGTINAKRFYASFRFPVTFKQRTFTGYTRDVSESSLNMSYRDIDGYYEYYRKDMGRSFRAMLGVSYSFRKGKSKGNKQRKVRTFESSSESTVRSY